MKIAYISTYPPRECGLATFNSNLMKAINANFDSPLQESSLVVALNPAEDIEQYAYPKEVKFIIRQHHQQDYTDAAKFINESDVDACILQHEFGIYGGENGIFVLPFIDQLEKPIIAILHTVLKNPNYLQKSITKEIARCAQKLVVMSNKAVDFLVNVYGVERNKVKVIEHGVPDLEPSLVNPVKSMPLLKGKKLLLTFGLISRNKGLETVIKALPEIIKHHPDTVYVVLGNTHPGVLQDSGEEYREYLQNLALGLNVQEHLIFMNKFVDENQLHDFLTASDIYITPYFNEAQITSGTLAYAIGAGAAVVSTPYWHAQELLDHNRGRLFNFKDSLGLAEIVNQLLSSPDKLQALKTNAFEYGLKVRWPKIGGQFLALLDRCTHHIGNENHPQPQPVNIELMPEFSLDYIIRLTDDTGIFQHAKFGVPNRNEGYCIDDNSRALILALMAYQQQQNIEALKLMPIYLSYIHHLQLANGNFRNFTSFDRQFLDEQGSDDSFGRTVWALGYLINQSPYRSYAEFGYELFYKAIAHFKNLTHLRGICNTILGVSYYLKTHPYDENLLLELNTLSNKIINAFESSKDEKWKWFEDKLTYDNAIFPLALFHVFEITGDEKVKEVAFEALNYLEKITFSLKSVCPVGNKGWHSKQTEVAPMFDQQAIELMAMVLMYQQAHKVTRDSAYLTKLFTSYLWFLGENILRIPLYDPQTKGCADGLQAGGVNRNQGAESSIAYLISHLTVLDALKYENKLQGQKSSLIRASL